MEEQSGEDYWTIHDDYAVQYFGFVPQTLFNGLYNVIWEYTKEAMSTLNENVLFTFKEKVCEEELHSVSLHQKEVIMDRLNAKFDKAEICFVERQNLFGRIAYRSGCMDKDVCSRQERNATDVCVHCCHGDYCNSKDCGENGLPDRYHRGPVCFDCPHVFSPEECTSVTMCGRYQFCGIEEFPWGEHSHFKLGCSNEMCDPLKRSISHIQDRSVPVCKSCCNDDYCNTNCTITKDEPNIIIG